MKMKKKLGLLSLVFVCSLCLAGAGQAWAQCTDPGKPVVTLAGDITSDMTLSAANVYAISGLVVVTNGATLTIPAGTTLYGLPGSGTATSYMIIDTAGNGGYSQGARIVANGTAAAPIIFTSKVAYENGEAFGAPGQWGGLTIVGRAGNAQVACYEVNEDFCPRSTNTADNSGTLTYVQINNSGITMEPDKEINGLSLCAVGSGTTIDHITVNRSDDDCVELWGGTVNMSNVTTNICTDDQFDIDDGYSGTVTNLTIYQDGGNAAMEMSGATVATFNGLTITQVNSAKEGVLYFKESNGIGGHFSNVTICDEDYDAAYGVFHTNAATGSLGTITMSNIDVWSQNLESTYSAPGTAASAAQILGIFTTCEGTTCSDNSVPCP